MSRKLLLFTILFIFQYSIIVSDDDCSSSFEAFKEAECLNLKNTSHQCYYSNNKCYGTEIKTTCSSYIVTTGTINEKICTSIQLADTKKKCIVKNNACVEDDIACEDFKDSTSCIGFLPGTNKRCIFNKNKCETHYDKCEYITEEIKDKCNSNIPDPTKETDDKNKCYWEGSSCNAVERKCTEYADIKDILNFPKSCKDLVATSSKKCILDESNNCIEALAGCNSYTGDLESECNDYKSIDLNNKVIPSNKCAFDSSSNPKCYDLPLITCDAYNKLVTVPDKRVGTDCTKIIPYKDEQIDEHSKCEFDTSQKCTNKEKKCSEIEDEIICRDHILEDTEKQCIFKNNQCLEQYKTCSLYNTKVTTKTKPECIAIQESAAKRCNFTDEGTCVSVDKEECNEYQSGEPEEFCTKIKEANTTHRCAFINNQCIEQFKTCNSYVSQNNEVLNREICESIIHTSPNKRCILKNDTTCVEKKKECSDYTGDLETECITNYEPLDETNYKCAFKDNKCIEIPSYSYCSQYIGKDKNICESINLSDSPTYKCSLVNERCQKVEKPCLDGKNIEGCEGITPKDSKKECVFLNGICTEQYKTCEDYNDDANVKKITRDICESIISKETDNDGNTVIKTCVYAEGAGEAKGSCTSRKKYCEDFSSELYQTNCNSIPLTDKTQKCIYNAGTCSVSKKNCLDVIFPVGEKDIETKCNSLPVEGQNKICTVRSDNKGCKEEDKPKDPSNSPTTTTTTPSKGGSTTKKDTNSNNDGQGEGNNSGKEIYLNELLIIILCLLF